MMVVPSRTYKRLRPFDILRLNLEREEFWPGEEPVYMRGCKMRRKWDHDARYTNRDGYLFDLRDRWLRRFKPTAVSSEQIRKLYGDLNHRILARYHMEGRRFTESLWRNYAVVDGKEVFVSDLASVFIQLAKQLSDEG